MITHQSCSSAATEKLGERLVKRVLRRKPQKQAVLVGLVGELGSGKTTFVQGFFRGLGIRERALSPTFVIMRRLKLRSKKFENLFHVDAYRIKNSREIIQLGLNEIVGNPRNIVLIEWADRLKKILPRGIIRLRFRHGKKENRRTIRVGKNIF